MLKIIPNPDKEKFDKITDALIQTGNYCPCMVFQNEDTKCMCKAFREQTVPGPCHCGRFIKVEQ